MQHDAGMLYLIVAQLRDDIAIFNGRRIMIYRQRKARKSPARKLIVTSPIKHVKRHDIIGHVCNIQRHRLHSSVGDQAQQMICWLPEATKISYGRAPAAAMRLHAAMKC